MLDLVVRNALVHDGSGMPAYRGEIGVLLYNGGHETYYVKHEDRVAQMLVVPIPIVELLEVDALTPTLRGESGFGSTGQ